MAIERWVFLTFSFFADAFGSDGRAKLFALAEELIGLPRAVSLAQNYPNPFNSATTIEYALRSASGVLLEVYDLGGQRVRKLVDHYHDGGRYQVSWDGLDKVGKRLTRSSSPPPYSPRQSGRDAQDDANEVG